MVDGITEKRSRPPRHALGWLPWNNLTSNASFDLPSSQTLWPELLYWLTFRNERICWKIWSVLKLDQALEVFQKKVNLCLVCFLVVVPRGWPASTGLALFLVCIVEYLGFLWTAEVAGLLDEIELRALFPKRKGMILFMEPRIVEIRTALAVYSSFEINWDLRSGHTQCPIERECSQNITLHENQISL